MDDPTDPTQGTSRPAGPSPLAAALWVLAVMAAVVLAASLLLAFGPSV